MSLDRDLARWVAAGLIDARTSAAIHAFEAARVPHDQRRLVWIAASLAGLAVALGIVAILAANWDAISGATKIAADLVLLGGLGAGMVRARTRGPTWAFEALMFAFVGLVLASLGLVVQQTQLDLHFPWMSLLWLALVTPTWLHARASFNHGVLVTALLVTWYALLGEIPDDRTWTPSLRPLLGMSAPLTLIVLAPLAARGGHDGFARTASGIGWVGLVLASSFGTMAFYGGRPFPWDDPDLGPWLIGWAAGAAWIAVLTALAVRATTLFAFPAGTPTAASRVVGWAPGSSVHGKTAPALRARRGLLLASAASMVLPTLLTPGEALPALAALTFLAYWVWLARSVLRMGRPALIDGIAIVIGIRLLIVYGEVLGSLLDTGLALIGGGLLALLLLAIWVRRRATIAAVAVGAPSSDLAT